MKDGINIIGRRIQMTSDFHKNFIRVYVINDISKSIKKKH